MKDYVSDRRTAVFALGQLSVVGAACSIVVPHGSPWMGLGWGILACVAALGITAGGAPAAVLARATTPRRV